MQKKIMAAASIGAGIAEEKTAVAARFSKSGSKSSVDARYAKADDTMGLTKDEVSKGFTRDEVTSALSTEYASSTYKQYLAKTGYKPGAIIEVPLGDLVDNPQNARYVYVDQKITEMAVSLKVDGQQYPGIAAPIPDNPEKLYLVDGAYRKRGLMRIGQPTMRVTVVDLDSPAARYKLSFKLNDERNAQTALDNAFAWKALLAEGVVATQDDIAALTGVSQSSIAKVLALAELPADVLEAFKAAPEMLNPTIGYQLKIFAERASAKDLNEIVRRTLDGDMSVRELIGLNEKQAKQGQVRRIHSRQSRLDFEGKKIGVIRDWDDGRLIVEVKGLPDEIRTSIAKAVREILSQTN